MRPLCLLHRLCVGDLRLQVANFDNSDSYSDCLAKIKLKNGATFKFDCESFLAGSLLSLTLCVSSAAPATSQ